MYIVIPTINRKDLLYENLESLNSQSVFINQILIIDNGNQDINKNKFNEIKNKIQIIIPNRNLGVAGSWNTGIKIFNNKEYILFLNDDIVLFENQIDKIKNLILSSSDLIFIGEFFWSVFVLKKQLWDFFLEKDKYIFDEQFYPAYFEDNDFAYRCKINNINIHYSKLLDPKIKRNSQTILKDPTLNKDFELNKKRYILKWGGEPGKETKR